MRRASGLIRLLDYWVLKLLPLSCLDRFHLLHSLILELDDEGGCRRVGLGRRKEGNLVAAVLGRRA